MNLPTEYVTRNNRAHAMLTLPCSLFLETQAKKKNDRLSGKIVLLLEETVDEHVKVQRYDLPQLKQNGVPNPALNPVVIPFDKVFTDESVIIPNTKLVPFCETPYTFRGKQEQSMPNSVLQEKDYHSVLDNFFNPSLTKNRREEWLWDAFEKLNIGSDVRARYAARFMRNEQEVVAHYSKAAWKLWEKWKELFLVSSGVASELAFHKEFANAVESLEMEPVDDPENAPVMDDAFLIAAGHLPRYQNRRGMGPLGSSAADMLRRRRQNSG